MAEKRLISLDEAIAKVKDDGILGEGYSDYERIEDVCDILESCEIVDAAEVVRCRDCAKDGLFTCPICFIENKTLQFINISPDFFCGEGERKDVGQ